MFPIIFGGLPQSVEAWNPSRLPGTPREWLAGPTWCFTDTAGTIPAGDTDAVAAWRDRWQGTLVTQTDPLRRPTLRLVSGKWCVRFDGVNDTMRGTYTRNQPHECYYVGTLRNDGRVASDGFNGNTAYIWCDLVSATYRYLIYPGAANVGSVVSTDGAQVILRGLFSGTSSEVQVNNGATITGGGGTLATNGLTLGSIGGGTGTFPSAVDINNFVDAGQAIDPADRARLWAYLNALWGVY